MATPGVVGQQNTPPSLVQKVVLRISCKNLPNKDLGSRSDPCAVLSLRQGEKYIEVGRTESLQNTLNPTFTQTITINYHFETVQYVRIRIYDVDNKTEKLKDDDFLGQIKCTLAQIVSNKTFTSVLLKKHKKPIPNCFITILAEEVRENKEMATFTFAANNLDNKDFLSKSDPFLELSRVLPDGSCHVLHRTEVVKNCLKPEWRPFTLDLLTICSGDWSKPIKLTVYDMDKNGSHDLIGEVKTSMNEMHKAIRTTMRWPCINESKKNKKKDYKDSGTIILSSVQMLKEFSFLEYIFGGLQFNLTVAVDFTLSNGKPDDPKSLHYIHQDFPNEYMKAITAVGTVLQEYDADKMIPALGFGALIPPEMTASFEFPLNFNLQNPFCAGVQGVLDAYINCLPKIQLYKPTKVAPIIRHVIRFAEDAQKGEVLGKGASTYYILLLLTDGVFFDLDKVKEAIVVASGLPMSIIIVGVGQEDFTDMVKLDGDNGLVISRSEMAKRDSVQFVPLRDFQYSQPGEMARHVLAEIPHHVTQYFKMRKLPPNKTYYDYPVLPA